MLKECVCMGIGWYVSDPSGMHAGPCAQPAHGITRRMLCSMPYTSSWIALAAFATHACALHGDTMRMDPHIQTHNLTHACVPGVHSVSLALHVRLGKYVSTTQQGLGLRVMLVEQPSGKAVPGAQHTSALSYTPLPVEGFRGEEGYGKKRHATVSVFNLGCRSGKCGTHY